MKHKPGTSHRYHGNPRHPALTALLVASNTSFAQQAADHLLASTAVPVTSFCQSCEATLVALACVWRGAVARESTSSSSLSSPVRTLKRLFSLRNSTPACWATARLSTFAEGVTHNDIAEAKLFDQLPVTYSPKWLRENPEASAAGAAATATATATT